MLSNQTLIAMTHLKQWYYFLPVICQDCVQIFIILPEQHFEVSNIHIEFRLKIENEPVNGLVGLPKKKTFVLFFIRSLVIP